MIGIGEQDARVEFAGQLARRKAFDGGLRAHRHEDRRFDYAVRRREPAGARARHGAIGLDLEM